jgi:hypothetical protein
MKTATGLTLIAIGAVLAFAVNGHPGFLNLQVVGWIIMIIGVAGLAIPRRGYGWLRRQVVMRRGPERVVGVQTRRNPSYIMIDPAAADEPEVGGESAPIPGVAEHTEPKEWVNTSAVPTTRAMPTTSAAPASTPPASTAPASTAPASTAPASTAPASTAPASTAPISGVARSWPEGERVVPDEETVEEFFEE